MVHKNKRIKGRKGISLEKGRVVMFGLKGTIYIIYNNDQTPKTKYNSKTPRNSSTLACDHTRVVEY